MFLLEHFLFKEELKPILQNTFQKTKRGNTSNSLYETSNMLIPKTDIREKTHYG